QATNTVAAFGSSDSNGFVISFPSVNASGATTVSGTMTFGVGTQSDNALGGATVYALDQCGDIPTATYNNVTYSDTSCGSGSGTSFGAFLDTGTNALAVLDANTLSPIGISDCAQNTRGVGFYCASGGSAVISNIGLAGNGSVGSGMISLNIAD